MIRIIPILFCLIFALTLLASCAQQQQPPTAAELLNLGEKYLLDLDYEQALVQFLAVIEIEPMNPRGYTGAAQAYVGLGRVEEAVAVLEQGLERLPENTEIAAMLDNLGERGNVTVTDEEGNPPDSNSPELDIAFNTAQLAFLLPLENALLAYDMSIAFPIMVSAEFRELCRSLPNEHGCTYKTDDYGEWLLAYTLLRTEYGEDIENCEISLTTDWNEGNIFLSEAHWINENLSDVWLETYDIIDGSVDYARYNIIKAYTRDGTVIIEPMVEGDAQL